MDEDPRELHDLALDSSAEVRLRPWRERMAAVLDGRPEGFVDGGKLVAGRPHGHVIAGYEPNKTFRSCDAAGGFAQTNPDNRNDPTRR